MHHQQCENWLGKGAMVDLIIGGASKAGTTALYDMLKQRDEFFLPEKKELHYFSWPELSNTTGGPGDRHVIAEIPSTLEEYLAFYRGKREGQIAVDISPSYLFHHNSADRMNAALPEVRVIFILRNPVDKVFSQYVHLVGEGRETLGFEDALVAESVRKEQGYSDMWLYRESGFYADAIDHFQRVLGKNRVMIIIFEDFRRDPKAVLNDICTFAGLDGRQEFDTDLHANVSGAPRSLLLAKLISPNRFTRFLRRIIPTKVGVAIRRAVRHANTGRKPELSLSTRRELLECYRGDVRRLENLLNVHTNWMSAKES